MMNLVPRHLVTAPPTPGPNLMGNLLAAKAGRDLEESKTYDSVTL